PPYRLRAPSRNRVRGRRSASPNWDPDTQCNGTLASAETLKTTAAERAYISALALFFRNSDQHEPLERATAYSQAMSRIYQDYPADMEAGAFYALSLLASEPENDTT